MPLRGSVNDCLDARMHQYGKHVRAARAYDKDAKYPLQSWANGILRMFLVQQVTSPGQHTRELYLWL
jgi:hypothetical protein